MSVGLVSTVILARLFVPRFQFGGDAACFEESSVTGSHRINRSSPRG